MIALLRPGQHRQLIFPKHHGEAVPDGQIIRGAVLRRRAEGQLLQQAVGAALQQAQHQLAVLLRHEIHRAAELLLLQGHHLLAGDIQGVHQLAAGRHGGAAPVIIRLHRDVPQAIALRRPVGLGLRRRVDAQSGEGAALQRQAEGSEVHGGGDPGEVVAVDLIAAVCVAGQRHGEVVGRSHRDAQGREGYGIANVPRAVDIDKVFAAGPGGAAEGQGQVLPVVRQMHRHVHRLLAGGTGLPQDLPADGVAVVLLIYQQALDVVAIAVKDPLPAPVAVRQPEGCVGGVGGGVVVHAPLQAVLLHADAGGHMQALCGGGVANGAGVRHRQRQGLGAQGHSGSRQGHGTHQRQGQNGSPCAFHVTPPRPAAGSGPCGPDPPDSDTSASHGSPDPRPPSPAGRCLR